MLRIVLKQYLEAEHCKFSISVNNKPEVEYVNIQDSFYFMNTYKKYKCDA